MVTIHQEICPYKVILNIIKNIKGKCVEFEKPGLSYLIFLSLPILRTLPWLYFKQVENEKKVCPFLKIGKVSVGVQLKCLCMKNCFSRSSLLSYWSHPQDFLFLFKKTQSCRFSVNFLKKIFSKFLIGKKSFKNFFF